MSKSKLEENIGRTIHPTKLTSAKARKLSSELTFNSVDSGSTLKQKTGIEKNKSERVSGNVSPIVVDGEKFKSQSAAARHFGIDIAIFTVRLHRGWSPEQAAGLEAYVPGERSGDWIMVEGKSFQSHIQAAKFYAISYRTFKSRLDRGWTPEQAAGIERHVTSKVIKEPIIIENVEYKSISAAARRYGISRQTFHLRMKNGKSAEEAAGILKAARPNKAPTIEDTSVTVGGMVFKNYIEAAKKFNVPLATFMENLGE